MAGAVRVLDEVLVEGLVGVRVVYIDLHSSFCEASQLFISLLFQVRAPSLFDAFEEDCE